MDCEKQWVNYILQTIETKKLDQMIIEMKCQIPGCRTSNKKSLRGFHRSIKVGALMKRKAIEREVMMCLEKIYAKTLEEEAVQNYLKMTPSDFISQLDAFIEKENQEVQICVVNHFLMTSARIDLEQEQILTYFKPQQEERKSAPPVQTQKKSIKVEPKEAIHKEDQSQESEKLSKSQIKDYKIVKCLYEEAKEKVKEQEKTIQSLTKEIKALMTKAENDSKTYEKEIKSLKSAAHKLDQQLEHLMTEKMALEDKLKQAKIGMPYVFIGSSFIKQKVDRLKNESYPEVNMLYISTKQFKNGLGKPKQEVAEVYAFFYDLEWLVREELYKYYDGKIKVFSSDELFYDYIETCWEA